MVYNLAHQLQRGLEIGDGSIAGQRVFEVSNREVAICGRAQVAEPFVADGLQFRLPFRKRLQRRQGRRKLLVLDEQLDGPLLQALRARSAVGSVKRFIERRKKLDKN